MDIVLWIVLLVIVAGVVWWLVNRNSSAKKAGGTGATGTQSTGSPPPAHPGADSRGDTRADGALSGGGAAASAAAAGTAGIASAAGFGGPAEPAAPTTADEPADSAARDAQAQDSAAVEDRADGVQADGGLGVSTERDRGPGDPGQDSQREERRLQDQAEWETQWSEAGGSGTPNAGHQAASPPVVSQDGGHAAPSATEAAAPVHHAEYTDPHAPTLPGAETAAVEEPDVAGTGAETPGPDGADAADIGQSGSAAGAAPATAQDVAAAETADRTQSSSLVENGAGHQQSAPSPIFGGAEPLGHLAADEPYGAGSAAAGADGSGPADYTVKGDAGSMVYYEEGHPDYGQTRAEVWFESAAHAEAAGFRAPPRRRL